MKKVKWLFLLFAIMTATCMIGIGISVGERSVIGIIACSIATIASFGIGFTAKSKLLRE